MEVAVYGRRIQRGLLRKSDGSFVEELAPRACEMRGWLCEVTHMRLRVAVRFSLEAGLMPTATCTQPHHPSNGGLRHIICATRIGASVLLTYTCTALLQELYYVCHQSHTIHGEKCAVRADRTALLLH